MNTTNDQNDRLEFLLSQYLDGGLPEAEARQLEDRLRQDVESAARLDRLRCTDRLVRASAGPVPELDWVRFAEKVSRRRQEAEGLRRRRQLLRILVPLSAAAAVLLLVTVLWTADKGGPGSTESRPFAEVNVRRVLVDGAALTTELACAEVSLARPPELEIVDNRRPTQGGIVVATVAVVARSARATGPSAPYF